MSIACTLVGVLAISTVFFLVRHKIPFNSQEPPGFVSTLGTPLDWLHLIPRECGIADRVVGRKTPDEARIKRECGKQYWTTVESRFDIFSVGPYMSSQDSPNALVDRDMKGRERRRGERVPKNQSKPRPARCIGSFSYHVLKKEISICDIRNCQIDSRIYLHARTHAPLFLPRK